MDLAFLSLSQGWKTYEKCREICEKPVSLVRSEPVSSTITMPPKKLVADSTTTATKPGTKHRVESGKNASKSGLADAGPEVSAGAKRTNEGGDNEPAQKRVSISTFYSLSIVLTI
jgi:hypothetical protein